MSLKLRIQILGALFLSPCVHAAGLTVSGGTVTIADAAQLATSSNVTLTKGALVAHQSLILVQGNWSNSGGTFSPGTSTVTFNGSGGQTVNNAGQAFATLIDSNTSGAGITFTSSFSASGFTINSAGLASATTVYFNAASTYTIANIAWTGSSGNMPSLRSSSQTHSWYLKNTSTNTVSFVDAQDSNADAGLVITAGPQSIDSGNNSNWTFVILSVSLSPTSYGFGSVHVADTVVSTSGITATNTGNVAETYALSITTSGATSAWSVGTSTPTAYNTFAMFGKFNSIALSSNTFTAADVIISTPSASTTHIYASDQTGYDTPIGSARNLWFRLDMPQTTSTTAQEQMQVEVTATPP